MNNKTISARIRPGLVAKVEAAEAAGRTKTEIVEAALEAYLKDKQEGQEGQEGEDLTKSPEPVTLDNIRAVVREMVRDELRQAGRTAAPKRPTAPDMGKLEESAELVDRVLKIYDAGGCTLREACKIGGTSWPSFSRRRKALQEKGEL